MGKFIVRVHSEMPYWGLHASEDCFNPWTVWALHEPDNFENTIGKRTARTEWDGGLDFHSGGESTDDLHVFVGDIDDRATRGAGDTRGLEQAAQTYRTAALKTFEGFYPRRRWLIPIHRIASDSRSEGHQIPCTHP